MITFLLKLKAAYNYFSFRLGILLKKRNRTVYKNYKSIVQNSIKSDEERYQNMLDNLNKLLNYANRHTVYYSELFKKINLVNEKSNNIELKEISELEKIPILNKRIISERFTDLISDEAKNLKAYKNSSGGSTGEKAVFLQHDEFKRFHTANYFYFLHKIGIKPWQKITLLIWGSQNDIGKPTIPNNLFKYFLKNNSVLLNSSSLTNKEIRDCIEILKKIKFDYIRGYSQSLFIIAKYINANAINIKPQNKIVSTATMLNKQMRDEIEKAFKADVYDFYGSREVGAISFENKKVGALEVLTNNNLLEIMESNGRIIITNLHNYAMPLIRYDIGDTASGYFKKGKYKYFYIKKLMGRTADNFFKINGDIVDGTFLTTIMNGIDNLRSFQIIQLDYTKFEFRVVLSGPLNIKEQLAVENKFKLMFGKDSEFTWVNVKKIEPTESGKYLYIISKIVK